MNILANRKGVLVSALLIAVVALMIAFSGSVNANPGSSANTETVNQVTYVVEISGLADNGMALKEMPVSSVEFIEFTDGEDSVIRKRPGRTSCSNMILTSDPNNPALDSIWDWFDNVKNGQYDRRSITITMVDSHYEPITRYVTMGVWPAEWRVVEQEEQGNNATVLIEVEFVVEELFRQSYE